MKTNPSPNRNTLLFINRYTGNFPDIVVAVDKVAEYCWVKAMDTAIGQITQRVHHN